MLVVGDEGLLPALSIGAQPLVLIPPLLQHHLEAPVGEVKLEGDAAAGAAQLDGVLVAIHCRIYCASLPEIPAGMADNAETNTMHLQ